MTRKSILHGAARREYATRIHESLEYEVRQSAERIVPFVVDLLQPKSVVDVGCGTGVWLSVFRNQGVSTILGIDGDYVDRNRLKIPADTFMAFDLTRKLVLDQTFDLVVCLEVAEHLPESSAKGLIEGLTDIGSVVLFSAAIPYQGGIGHANEQWPDYWVAKFEECSFEVVDCIRPRVWTDPEVAFYCQNALLFVRRGSSPSSSAQIRALKAATSHGMLSIVHPRLYVGTARPTLSAALRLAKQTAMSVVNSALHPRGTAG